LPTARRLNSLMLCQNKCRLRQLQVRELDVDWFRETDCMAGHVRFELANPSARYPIEVRWQFRLRSASTNAGETVRVRAAGSDFAARSHNRSGLRGEVRKEKSPAGERGSSQGMTPRDDQKGSSVRVQAACARGTTLIWGRVGRSDRLASCLRLHRVGQDLRPGDACDPPAPPSAAG
jgi:hypothetical protein